VNMSLAVFAVSLRTGAPLARIWAGSIRSSLFGAIAQVFIAWLMAEVGIKVGLWATSLFMVPSLLARYSFTKYAETRALFFGTVSALSPAIDAKDGFTRGHAKRAARTAGAMAPAMGLPQRHSEEMQLAGMSAASAHRGMDQLNRYKGIQFDPRVVRALGSLLDKRGADAFEVSQLPPINYETLAELRKRLAREPLARDAHAG